jgi:transposase
MRLIHERCAGLDVHKDTVVACVRIARDAAEAQLETQTFGTKTPELLRLSDWLKTHEVKAVVMESTGVYWKPIWHVLEEEFELVLGNAAAIRNVPGRKTDVSDAQWLAELLAHGLVRASFVPKLEQAEVRGLTRTRRQLVTEIGQHVQRVQKVLEDANIKLDSVVSDIQGKAAREILDAIVDGKKSPKELAALKGRLKASFEELEAALSGRPNAYHRFEIKLHLQLIDQLRKAVADVEGRLGSALSPFREAAQRLATIPGWGPLTVDAFIGEAGTDMTRFPTEAHLRSWIRVCPRSDESAGKHRSRRVRRGGAWLKPALLQAAWAATRANGTYLQALYRRLRPRRGPKKAAMAVVASMVTSAFHMLKNNCDYADLGADHFVKRERPRLIAKYLRQLERLGIQVPVPTSQLVFAS